MQFLSGFSPVAGVVDRWSWGTDANNSFSVNVAYKNLSKRSCSPSTQRPDVESLKCIWKASATMKAKITAWRLIRNCLPTKDNVGKRIALEEEEKSCVWCGLVNESATHIFLECGEVPQLRNLVIDWIGAVWVASRNIHLHFFSFAAFLGGKRWRRRLCGLWVCTIWIIWRWRNDAVFDHKLWDLRRILEEIKYRFWSWCAVRGEVEAIMFYGSWANKTLVSHWRREM